MSDNNKMSIFAIIFAVVIQLVAIFVFDAPAWASFLTFFVALIYFRVVMRD